MSKELLVKYDHLNDDLRSLEQNFGVRLWISWKRTPIGVKNNSPETVTEVNEQLVEFTKFLQKAGVSVQKLVQVFNNRSGSQIGLSESGFLQFRSGSPSSVSPKAIMGVIADLADEDWLQLIMQ